MNPHKTILIIDPHEDRRGATRFMLRTKGFRVLDAASVPEAEEVIANDEREIYLLIGYWPINERRFARLGWDFEVPTLYIAAADKATTLNVANATLDISTNTRELLDRIRIMVARKPGPKKTVTSVSVPAERVA